MSPRRLGLDPCDNLRVGDEGFEEVGTCSARSPGASEHVFELIDAVGCQGEDRLVDVGVDGDDRVVGQVVVVGDDGLNEFGVFAEPFGDIADGEDG